MKKNRGYNPAGKQMNHFFPRLSRGVLIFSVMTGFFFLGWPLPLYSQNDNNLAFLNRILQQNNSDTAKSRQRIVTGRLLTTDDPAGNAVYDRLKRHMEYLTVNIRNQNDLILYYRVRDGYLASMINSLQRIRELVLMKSNSFYGPTEQEIIDSEIALHYEGIRKTISRAEFNTKPVFASWINDEKLETRFAQSEFYSIDGVDRILKRVIAERSRQGALVNSLSHRIKGEGVQRENTTQSYSLGDTDFAVEFSNLQKSEILFFSDLFLLDMHTGMETK